MTPAHLRVSAIGYLGTPSSEQFVYSINCTTDGTGGLLDMQPNQDAWQDLADDVRDFHGRVASRISDKAVLQTVKIAHIGAGTVDHPGGVYTQEPLVFAYNQPGGVNWAGQEMATDNQVNIPQRANGLILPQTALAVSLNTDRRGASGRGRFFLPMPAVETDPSNGFRIGVEDAEGIRDSVVQLLNGIANQPGLDLIDIIPSVVSTKGFASPVTSVRVGRVLDTIRSRRRALGEAYTADAPVDFT